jgi:hypothetical protein
MRLFGGERNRGESQITMNVKDVAYEVVYWINLAQDRVQRWAPVNKVMEFLVA